MNILHITEDYSINSGGLRTVIKELDFFLNEQEGIKSFIMSSKKEDEDIIQEVQESIGKPWLYSKMWGEEISKICSKKNIDLIHIHGVWMYPQYIAAKFSLIKNIPFIVSPHGMYEPWLWTKGTLKKKLYFNMLSKGLFSRASVIHAITQDEKRNLKTLFPKTEIQVIPNLIDFTKHEYYESSNEHERYLFYLGRLHEKKGIELIIKSLAKLNDKTIKLKIAGAFTDYKKDLEKIIEELNLNNRVQFLGLLKGEEKLDVYKNAFVFAAPSYSEVVGMVNLEAASQKTPVITTFQTGLSREWSNNGGILINPNVKELTIALNTVLNWTPEERNNKGEELYFFVKENYSWQSRIKDWINLYESQINQ